MIYYVYFTNGGTPETGLNPIWSSLRTGQSGGDKNATAPVITELGNGWYRFEITFGQAPWDIITEDLVGVIDGGDELADVDRYKPVAITLRGLALARIAHKGVQDKASGHIDIFATDGVSKEMTLEMSDEQACIVRNPAGSG
ncbi:MAG: hypothetical protein JW860_08320 [Sedimentisphaerales bacterium]|nr:hypothetical protein [Sedimentisphaerales bacterium]